jgi:hypothetical protein
MKIGFKWRWRAALRNFSRDITGKPIAPCGKPTIPSGEVMGFCEQYSMWLSDNWPERWDPPNWTAEEKARYLDAAESYFARLHRLEMLIPIGDEWPEDALEDFKARFKGRETDLP